MIIRSWDTIFQLWHLVFFSKPIEIETGSKHKNPIFGEENEFGGHENVTPRGKNNKHAVICLCNKFWGKKNVYDWINQSNWKFDLDISSSPHGSSTLALIANVPDNKFETKPLLRIQNKSKCSLIRETKVIVTQSKL